MSELAVQRQAPQAALRALKNPLYDTQEAPAAAAAVRNLVFFQSPLGNALNVTGALKTIAETNLNQSGQIGIPNEFELFGFNTTFTYDTGYIEDSVGGPFSVLANFLDDVAETYEQALFRFSFGQNRPYLQVPFTRIPHGDYMLTGPAAAAQDNGATGLNIFAISNGCSDKKEFYKFFVNDQPVPINSAENFNAELQWNNPYGLEAAGDESRITVYLVGVLYTAL
mgnify:CR=1 FL=1